MVEGGSGMSAVGDTLESESGEALVGGNMVWSLLRAYHWWGDLVTMKALLVWDF